MIARTERNQRTQFEYDYDNRLIKITYPDGSVIKFGYAVWGVGYGGKTAWEGETFTTMETG